MSETAEHSTSEEAPPPEKVEEVVTEAEEAVVEAAEEVKDDLEEGTETVADATEEVAEVVQEEAEEAAEELGEPELADHIAGRLMDKLHESGMLVTQHDARRANAAIPESTEAEIVNETPGEAAVEEVEEAVSPEPAPSDSPGRDAIRPQSEHWYTRPRRIGRFTL